MQAVRDFAGLFECQVRPQSQRLHRAVRDIGLIRHHLQRLGVRHSCRSRSQLYENSLLSGLSGNRRMASDRITLVRSAAAWVDAIAEGREDTDGHDETQKGLARRGL